MDRAKEGATILKSRIRAVKAVTVEQGARLERLTLDLERGLEELRRENERLTTRIAELERPRGLRRLWAWLFRRKQPVEAG
jgi:hypothetical protein